ncbi:tRNA1(Val) (adenine(37)-N6)-methyltransferase [Autumnicola psychrophila]|uniref:tRNA1(Val) (adenine(37)-N6)-methyltransferase n=1 Tax=Autumnicola psychrophila TaxID=3075592 RepID=A0ABU3DN67_9FLAO|nr:methyltransferase [Zunongwangia sp. F225]MDT0685159.1 methyltransferase [Zunongwangia sp. F225]
MSDQIFKFKEFSVAQDKAAMKIGTDGVLLGAWTPLDHNPESILDIGTGTGLIALIMAQRSGAFAIDAIEIEENAYEQAVENFENSNWGDRLFCYHADLNEFAEEMQDEEKYDLIISNPPFYAAPLSSEVAENEQKMPKARKLARFTDSLPFEHLVHGASVLLSQKGIFSVIIPYAEEENFIELASAVHLFPKKITRVRGTKDSALKRSLLAFSFRKTAVQTDELIIEISRHNYTEDYKKLVSPFYLKL